MSKAIYGEFVERLRKIKDVASATALLNWDKEVNMPPAGAALRSQQVATLSGIAHELFVDDHFGKTISRLAASKHEFSFAERRNIELVQKQFERNRKFDTEFVQRKSKIISEGYHAWVKAKQANDYSIFQPVLKKLVDVLREQVDRLGYENHPYEALLDEYEPGGKVATLDALFDDVKKKLIPLLNKINAGTPPEDSFLKQHFDKDKQWDFGIEILRRMGYDFDAGRQDITPHPFTISFGASDVRVTTRINPDHFNTMTWSCIHEGGHALYEQGLPTASYGLPSGEYASLGIHESQSRLWENNVGRSHDYWRANFPLLQSSFPKELGHVSLDAFVKAINKVEAQPIRVEADELTYHFHILIRYELEKALIEGSLDTEGLDEIWNQKYKEYLGIDIKGPAEGILQDVHWGYGSIGYFPTYSLGSFYAAQFFAQAKKDVPDLEDSIRNNDNRPLLDWLRESIHSHGAIYHSEDLCEKVTGRGLSLDDFMEYADRKFSWVYGV